MHLDHGQWAQDAGSGAERTAITKGDRAEAQHRARGSSAWRGALDIEISIVPGNDLTPMQIIQRKSKDAELAQDISVELQSYVIPNWFDEDGEPVSSAIIFPSQMPIKKDKKESKMASLIKQFDRFWWSDGATEK